MNTFLPWPRWVAALSVAVAALPAAVASGQGEPYDLFFSTRYVDLPLSAHWQHPGGLHLGRDSTYLITAYWRWGGAPATPEMGQALDKLLNWRATTVEPGAPPLKTQDAAEAWFKASEAAWRQISPKAAAAASAPGMVELVNGRQGSEFESQPTCYADTFDRARLTLAARLKAHAAEKAALKLWLEAQAAVIQTCGSQAAALPPLPKDAPLWLRQDHAWQTAAQQFHAGDWEAADKTYTAIQADASSEWRPWAPYMRLRIALRSGPPEGDASAATREVNALTEAVLADPRAQHLHASARRLRLTWGYRLQPEAGRTQALLQQLQQPGQPDEAAARLLLYRGASRWDLPAVDAYRKGRDDPQTTDLGRWLLSLNALGGEAALQLEIGLDAWQRWQRQGHPAWLLLASRALPWKHPQQVAVQAALAKLPMSHPAAYAARLERALVFYQAQRWGAQALLGTELQALPPYKASVSERNVVSALTLPAADSWARWTALALREPLGQADPENIEPSGVNPKPTKPEGASSLDEDVVAQLNLSVPLAQWLELSGDKRLAPGLRQSLLETLWTRAILTQRWKVAREAARRLLAWPGAQPAPLLASTVTLGDDEQAWRSVLVARLISPTEVVQGPFLRPPMYNNPTLPDAMAPTPWYGAGGQGGRLGDGGEKWCSTDAVSLAKLKATKPLLFLNAEQRAAQEDDQRAVLALPSDAIWLAQQALALKAQRADDPLVPDALALAVRLSRSTCAEAAVGTWSKRAFETLQRDYPRTTAAKTTKYWYSGR